MNEMLLFQQESEKLLDATLDMDGDAVATQVEKIHDDYVSAIQYNNENSLSSVLAIAYLSAMQYYFKPVRELPTGRASQTSFSFQNRSTEMTIRRLLWS